MNYLDKETVSAAGFHSFYNRSHFGQTTFDADNLGAFKVDISRWNCNASQVNDVRIETPEMLVTVNEYLHNRKGECRSVVAT